MNLYYISGSFGLTCIGIGAYYCYDKDGFIDNMGNLAWELTNTYHYLNDKLNEYVNVILNDGIEMNDEIDIVFDDEDSDDNDENNIEFLGYKILDDTTYTSKDITDNSYIIDNTFDIMFMTKIMNENKYFFRIMDKLNINDIDNDMFKEVDKIFLQVEIELNNTKHEIHKNLVYFYLNNNIILDSKFLSWYLSYFYGLTLNDDYILHIIDKDINMFTIKSDKSIKVIKIEENKYNYEII